MANNIFIFFETEDSQRKENISKRIKNLGNTTPVSDNFWYTNSEATSEQLVRHLSQDLTDMDQLLVVDAQNNQSHWFNMEDKKAVRLTQHWRM